MKQAKESAYTGLVKLALLAITATLASAQEYRVSAPNDIERVEWSVTGIGWDVDVSYDPDTCEVYCRYRRRHDLFGQMPLLPPVTALRFYTGPREPEVAVVDPAGLSTPAVEDGMTPPAVAGPTVPKRLSADPPQCVEARSRESRPVVPLHAGRPAKPIVTLRI